MAISSSELSTSTITIERGLDYILSHFQEPLWPRTISTRTTEGRQVLTSSRKEALARFVQANYLDCRISAYSPNADENPSAVERFAGLENITPTNIIVMIDLDRSNFTSERGFEMALSRTLGKIKEKFGTNPTVLWSGRGYHIILPLNSNNVELENIQEFQGVDNISLKFLRYAESYLSLSKSDSQHNYTVSFNNCMLRIPGSINSKNGETVKIVQMWDGYKPEINYLLAGFSRHIINEKYIELKNAKKRKQKKSPAHADQNNRINWIERLLQTPLQDYRKYCIWRILAPYLLNVKRLSEQETTDTIKDWLNQCNQLRRLDFNYKQKIKDGIEGAKEGYLPISREKLRNENSRLYFQLQDITNY
jgi:hypothetical protein